MRIAVTGSHGQLVRSLLEAAHSNETQVFALGRPAVDLTKPESLIRALENVAPDILVNAAAYTAVDQAESDAATAFNVNATGAGHAAKTCERLGIPLIHISTDYVFDGTKPTPYVESDPPHPATVYGRSKLAGELKVAEACARHVILRTAWLHSPFGHNFIKTILRLASQREQLSVVADQLGCPTYAPHLANAILAISARVLAENASSCWGTCHAVGEGSASWHDLALEALAVSRTLGGPSARVVAIPTSAYPTAAKRPANSRLDTSKLLATFDVRLPDWREGVAAGVGRLLSPPSTGQQPETRLH